VSNPTQVQYLSFLIERSAKNRFYVLDWDYESEEVVAGPFPSERAAQDYIVRREGLDLYHTHCR